MGGILLLMVDRIEIRDGREYRVTVLPPVNGELTQRVAPSVTMRRTQLDIDRGVHEILPKRGCK